MKGMLMLLILVAMAAYVYPLNVSAGQDGHRDVDAEIVPLGHQPPRVGSFRAPSQIQALDRNFGLAFSSQKNSQFLYEYTGGSETVNNWKTLIFIGYFKGLSVTPLRWGRAFARSAARDTPNYSVWAAKDNGYAKVIYEPNDKFPGYEVDVFRTYHLPACKGVVSLQYAVRPDVNDADSNDPKAKHEVLVKLAAVAEELANRIQVSDWAPDCSSK